jgi:hypothetical protein
MKHYTPDAFEKTITIYRKMLKTGVSREGVAQAMRLKNLDSSIICEVLGKAYVSPPQSPTAQTPFPTITIESPVQSPVQSPDSIVQSIIQKFQQRSAVGMNKYGTTLDRNDLTPSEWIQHAQEELMDGILYLEKLKTYL